MTLVGRSFRRTWEVHAIGFDDNHPFSALDVRSGNRHRPLEVRIGTHLRHDATANVHAHRWSVIEVSQWRLAAERDRHGSWRTLHPDRRSLARPAPFPPGGDVVFHFVPSVRESAHQATARLYVELANSNRRPATVGAHGARNHGQTYVVPISASKTFRNIEEPQETALLERQSP